MHGVFLTDAELDHTLGLLSLRQAAELHVYATAAVRALLTHCGIEMVVRRRSGVSLSMPAAVGFPVTLAAVLYKEGARVPVWLPVTGSSTSAPLAR
jgi:hypothetical protein